MLGGMHIHCWGHRDRVRVLVLLEWYMEQESKGMWCGGVCGVEGYVVWRGMWCIHFSPRECLSDTKQMYKCLKVGHDHAPLVPRVLRG